jgi:hypothetical protein
MQAWRQRAAQSGPARVLLGGEIKQHVERQAGLQSECAAFELHLAGIDASLTQTEARLAEEKASGETAERSENRVSSCEACLLAV